MLILYIFCLFDFCISARGRWNNLNTLRLFVLLENAPFLIIVCKSVELFLNKQRKCSDLTKIQIFSPNGTNGSQLSPNRSNKMFQKCRETIPLVQACFRFELSYTILKLLSKI